MDRKQACNAAPQGKVPPDSGDVVIAGYADVLPDLPYPRRESAAARQHRIITHAISGGGLGLLEQAGRYPADKVPA